MPAPKSLGWFLMSAASEMEIEACCLSVWSNCFQCILQIVSELRNLENCKATCMRASSSIGDLYLNVLSATSDIWAGRKRSPCALEVRQIENRKL